MNVVLHIIGVEAKEGEALVNSGAIHGKTLGFVADARLAADVRSADPVALLAAVAALRVVTHAPSPSYCAHQNRTAADCAGTLRAVRRAPFNSYPHGGQLYVVCLPARTMHPHGAHVW